MLCILSDTHDNTANISKAAAKIRAFNPELVIHCGDITSPPILDYFKDLPMRLVFGNCDGDREGIRNRARQLGFPAIDDQAIFQHAGLDICVYHGTRPNILEDLIDSQEYDLIFHGHTHIMRDEKVGHTRVINPGALYSASKYTFATLDLSSKVLQFIEV